MRSMRTANRTDIKYTGHRPAPFRERAAAFLDESTDTANQGPRDKSDGQERVHESGSRSEDAVSPRSGFFANNPTVRQRSRERLERGELGFDDRGGDDFDTPACSACTKTEIESPVYSRESGVEAPQCRPQLSANQHARLTNGQHIARSVVLCLVKFPFREVNREPGPCHRLTHLANHGGRIDVHLLGSHNSHGWGRVEN
jgi:hypothetical protein